MAVIARHATTPVFGLHFARGVFTAGLLGAGLIGAGGWIGATTQGAGPPTLPRLQVAPSAAQALVRAQERITAAEQAQRPGERALALAEARSLLEAYVEKPAGSGDWPTARMMLGRVLILQSRGIVAAAEKAAPEQREGSLKQARDHLRRAELSFSAAIDQLKGLSDQYPKFMAADDPNRAEAERLKGSMLQSLMAQAGAAEELAGTFSPGSDEANEHYKAAAERYERIYRDYRTLIAGLMARLKQGECCFRTGDTRRALGLYEDVLGQPADLEPLRRLRIAAMYLSLECWTTEREKLYELAFSQGEEYLTGLRPEEESWPEWQAVRYYTARGYQLAAGALGADRSADRTEYLDKARNHAEKLAAVAGPYQEAARSIVGTGKP